MVDRNLGPNDDHILITIDCINQTKILLNQTQSWQTAERMIVLHIKRFI